ncbi:SH3 domain-containing protein [Halomonas binhaiensis]|uniref:SEL1-like repeat protein n=1 Tax=Halomonas binhaiensis TaxID=2562282 RepID=A0A5C1NKU3_9GAMM|nr:SH3 domain-containing protein [Halomonas binhaiensis]QEM82459.1 SEL1-like repeat protein [Halomonas binhaiensis]
MGRKWILAGVVWAMAMPAMADYAAGLEEFQRGNYASSLYEWRQEAEKGDAKSQFSMGLLYEQGLGTRKSLEDARKWYRLAADNGHMEAQTRLGELYLTGQLEGGDAKAVEWFDKAAGQGDALAQFQLGMLYLEGRGVTADSEKAAGWLEQAAEKGVIQAQNNIGSLYENGQGVEQNATKAFELYEKAARQGDIYAQNNLGAMYAKGNGVERNSAWAVFWFTMAANGGNEVAVDNIPEVLDRLAIKQVAGSRVNIRRGAGTDYDVVAVLRRDDNVHVLGEMEGWSQVYFELNDFPELGWVSSSLLK